MKFAEFAIAFAVITLLTSCVTPRQMTRDEWISSTTRTYDGVTEDDVYRAAEDLYRLADGNDFKISYTQDTMLATRNWMVYAVIVVATGTHTWLIRTNDTPDGVEVSVQATAGGGSTITAAPTGGGGVDTMTLPGGGITPVNGTAIYDLFWARMDYLLGKSDHWMTCDELKQRRRDDIVWGSVEPLCLNSKDDIPSELSSDL